MSIRFDPIINRFKSLGSSLAIFPKKVNTIEGLLSPPDAVESMLSQIPTRQTLGFADKGGGGLYVWKPAEPKQNHNGGTIVDPDHDPVGAGGWYTPQNTGTGCWVHQVEKAINVKMFGAVGDGTVDDTAAITAAVEAANLQNNDVFFPAGDYFISDTLPFYGNVGWFGEGKTNDNEVFMQANDPGGPYGEMIAEPDGTMSFVPINGAGFSPDEVVTYRLMNGDVVRIENAENEANNGVFSIDHVEPENNKIFVKNPNAVTEIIGLEVRFFITVPWSGSAIRMHNLGDNSVVNGKRIIDTSGQNNVRIRDIGFVGPGINELWGGGLRFRREGNRAISGYDIKDVSIRHIPHDAVRFDQLINSNIKSLDVNKAVGDGIVFKPDPQSGGSNTSLNVETCFIRNVRRGIAAYTIAYSNFSNCVIEGADIGYYMNFTRGVNFDACGSETIKFNQLGSGHGETYRIVDSSATTINGKSVFYNTREQEWTKCATMFLDPKRRVESPAGKITTGHVHPSVGPKIPIVATRWQGDDGRFFVDVSQDFGYVPPSGDAASDWIGNSYWDDSIQVKAVDVQRDPLFNERYKVTGINKFPFIQSNQFEAPRPPEPTDDANAGFVEFSNVDGIWKDTSQIGSREGRYVCISDEPGAAIWVDAESLFEINVNMRDSPAGGTLGKQHVPLSESPFLIRAGRNYGVDITTDYVQRVLETESNNVGQIIAALDISEYLPVNYIAKIRNSGGDLIAELGIDKKSLEAIDTVTYLRVDLIENDPETFGVILPPAPDVFEANNDFIIFGDNGIPFKVQASFRFFSEQDDMISYWIGIDQFFNAGDQIIFKNTRLAEMEGTYSIDEANDAWFDMTTQTSEPIPCVRVQFDNTNVRTNIARTVDDAVYHHDKFSFPVSSELIVSGLDHLFIFDPASSIYIPQSREIPFTIPDTAAQVTVSLSGANNYGYEAVLPYSNQSVTIVGNTYNTVTVERNNTVGQVNGFLKCFRRLNPGYEIIYDRN